MPDAPRIPIFDTLGEFAGDLRAVVFRTQSAAAQHFGVNHATISRYESGAITPPQEYLAALAALAVEHQKLTGRPNEELQVRLLDVVNQAILASYSGGQSYPTWNDLIRSACKYGTSTGDPALALRAPASVSPVRMQIPYAEGVEAYFTDMEELRTHFADLVSSSRLERRLLVLHGVGGVGKTSLLRMFHLMSNDLHAPAGLASGDSANSALDVLTAWADELEGSGLALPAFARARQSYLSIQARIEQHARYVVQRSRRGVKENARSEDFEIHRSSISPVDRSAGPDNGDELVDWLRGFLRKDEISLALDPGRRLTDEFLMDIAAAAEAQRAVLMVDTYEQMPLLGEWVRSLAQRLHPNVLLVVGGRVLPDWHETWPGWLAQAEVHHLEPMTPATMRQLIRRYYATMVGDEPDQAQIEAIIRFARGLPLVVTTAVRLWVKYGVRDFAEVQAEVVGELVRHLRRGVPESMIPVLEAAAILRWFDKSILRAVTRLSDVDAAYEELRGFSFVKSSIDGLRVHDSVRQIMDYALRFEDYHRYRELHQRAADHFETYLLNVQLGSTLEKSSLEILYHRVCENEEAGLLQFQQRAEQLRRARRLTELRALINDADSYPLFLEHSGLWRRYYRAELDHLDWLGESAYAAFTEMIQTATNDSLLLAYLLSSYARLHRQTRFLVRVVHPESIVQLTEHSNMLLPDSDPRRVENLLTLGEVFIKLGEIDQGRRNLEDAARVSAKFGDNYGVVNSMLALVEMFARIGDWGNMFRTMAEVEQHLSASVTYSVYLQQIVLTTWAVAWSWAGRFREAETRIRRGLMMHDARDDRVGPLRDLGISVALQGRIEDSLRLFDQADQINIEFHRPQDLVTSSFRSFALILAGKLREAEDGLSKVLQQRKDARNFPGLPEIYVWLGQLAELDEKHSVAEQMYTAALELRWTRRLYFECLALTGLGRTNLLVGDVGDRQSYISEAEYLALRYEFNDCLAQLQLIRASADLVPSAIDRSTNLDSAFSWYKLALQFALRYNRFLLDEVLSGRPEGTPHQPIIPTCLARGEEGRRMLAQLADWWAAGLNDTGTPRPDTISPIPEGIPLLEAERLARRREPGIGTPQQTVLEQINAALEACSS